MLRVRARGDDGQRGTITLWILGLCLMLFLLGGISLDLWRSFSERRALAATADAAALAGASAIDENRYRQSGDVVLVPSEAEARARASVVDQLDKEALRDVEVHATTEVVTVVARGRVGLTLLNLLHTADVDIVVTATATPRRSS
jgi:Flp pilus assembly protein TadG